MKDHFKLQRLMAINQLIKEGYLKSSKIIRAMKKVKRELFMPVKYSKYAYADQPFPIPPYNGLQTISALHTYPIFYEPLKLKGSDKFLEIGMGSGYGSAVAKELIGKKGVVVSIEKNRKTYMFGKRNLSRTGYKDVITINDDGTKGYEKMAPYDKICVTASCNKIPEPLIEQLAKPGILIIPIGPQHPSQDLVMVEKDVSGKITKRKILEVIYVPLIGKHGYEN